MIAPTTPKPSPWTPERIATLKKLLGEGASCSEIAAELGGGITRNAVIGKIHRLGLQPQRKPGNPAPRRPGHRGGNVRQKLRRETAIAAARREALTDLEPETVANPIALAELELHHCRWPVDGAGLQTMFCGGNKFEKLSYCLRHCQMAYRGPEPPRSRARSEIARRTALKNLKERAA